MTKDFGQWYRDQLMSYFDVICDNWCHIHHLMSNCAYDIKIFHKSIWLILVSKEAWGPQWSNLLVHFWLTNCFKLKKMIIRKIGFFLYEFWQILCIIEVIFQKVKCCRKTLKTKVLHFLILNTDILLGQKVLATSGEVGSPY